MLVQNDQLIHSRLDARIEMCPVDGLVIALVFDAERHYPLLGVNCRVRKFRSRSTIKAE